MKCWTAFWPDGIVRPDRTPISNPDAGPVVPSYVVRPTLRCYIGHCATGPNAGAWNWLARWDGVGRGALQNKLNQKPNWAPVKRKLPVNRSLNRATATPVDRAHRRFRRHILTTGKGSFTLSCAENADAKRYKMPLPQGEPDK